MRPPRLFLERCELVPGLAETIHPPVAGGPADAVLATELGHFDLAALGLIPALLPLQHEIDLLLHHVRRFPGHRRVVDDVAVQNVRHVKDVLVLTCKGCSWFAPGHQTLAFRG